MLTIDTYNFILLHSRRFSTNPADGVRQLRRTFTELPARTWTPLVKKITGGTGQADEELLQRRGEQQPISNNQHLPLRAALKSVVYFWSFASLSTSTLLNND